MFCCRFQYCYEGTVTPFSLILLCWDRSPLCEFSFCFFCLRFFSQLPTQNCLVSVKLVFSRRKSFNVDLNRFAVSNWRLSFFNGKTITSTFFSFSQVLEDPRLWFSDADFSIPTSQGGNWDVCKKSSTVFFCCYRQCTEINLIV